MVQKLLQFLAEQGSIGAPRADQNGNNKGLGRVYITMIISGTATWTQVGPDFLGRILIMTIMVQMLVLSSDGTRIAICIMA